MSRTKTALVGEGRLLAEMVSGLTTCARQLRLKIVAVVDLQPGPDSPGTPYPVSRATIFVSSSPAATPAPHGGRDAQGLGGSLLRRDIGRPGVIPAPDGRFRRKRDG